MGQVQASRTTSRTWPNIKTQDIISYKNLVMIKKKGGKKCSKINLYKGVKNFQMNKKKNNVVFHTAFHQQQTYSNMVADQTRKVELVPT